MGHNHLGKLPRTRKWRDVVTLLAAGSALEDIAFKAGVAAEDGLHASRNDPGFVRVCWLIAQIPLAARSEDFVGGLRSLGLEVGDAPDLFEIASAFTKALDTHVARHGGRTDFGEMAQLAAVESLFAGASRTLPTLYTARPDDVRRAIGRLASGQHFGELGEEFFGRLTQRHLQYFLSRELANHVGKEGRQLRTIADQVAFNAALGLHCRETALIVREFSGDWFAKGAYHRGELTEQQAGRFAAHALRKIRSELAARRGADE